MKKSLLFLITGVITASLLTGCGEGAEKYSATEASASYESSYDDSYDVSDDLYEVNLASEAEFESPEEAYDEGSATEGIEKVDDSAVANSNRKIIKNVNIDAETEEFDSFISNIDAKVKSLGGYLESTDISGRSINASRATMRTANLTARIPSKNLDSFVSTVTDISNITNKNESAEDVTLSYADTEAHIKSLRTEQERLDQLLLQADDIQTIIAIESRITDVRYELESYESRLRSMDNKVDYSTVNIFVREVERYTPVETKEQTIGERIITGFTENCISVKDFFVNFFVELIIAIPVILLVLFFMAIPVVIIFFFVKFIIGLVRGPEYRASVKIKKAQKKAARKAKKADGAIKTENSAEAATETSEEAADKDNR